MLPLQPLLPSPDDARSEVRRELLDPEYYDQDLLQRLLDWVQRTIDAAVGGASGVPALTWLAATIIAVGLGSGLVALLSRARLGARRREVRPGVFTAEQVGAAELRARAEAAQREGRHAEALVEGFRALAAAQVEGGHLEAAPGSTAREVALALAELHPSRRTPLLEAARLFDAVLYGDRAATREEAETVLGLDRPLSDVPAGLR